MMEVNKEMTWEETVHNYAGKVVYGKVLGRKMYENINLPITMYVTHIPEVGRKLELLECRRFDGKLGDDTDEIAVPAIAYPKKGKNPYMGLKETYPN